MLFERLAQSLATFVTPRRILLILGLAILGGVVYWLLRTYGAALNPTAVRELLSGAGPWGPVLLILGLGLVLVVPAIPATVLQIGAGLAFGPPLGLVYVLIADLVGATAGFWLARSGRTLLESRISESSRATLDRMSKRITWRSMLLLRLLPGPAYPLVSFAAGYSPIGFVPYTLSSLLGVLPSLALLVLAGDLVTSSPLLAFGVVALLAGGLALAGRFLTQPAE